MRHGGFGMKLPALQQFHEAHHLAEAAHPRAVQGQLLVNQERAGRKRRRAALTHEHHPAPLAGGFQAQVAGRLGPGAVDRHLEAVPAAEASQFVQCRVGGRDEVGKAQRAGQLAPLGHAFHAHHGCAHGAGQHGDAQAHRPQTRHQYPVTARDGGAQAGRVSGAEAAGHQCAVHVTQRVRQLHQMRGVGQQVGRMPAVALPAVGPPPNRVAARDHVAAAARQAHPAAADVVDHHPVPGLEDPRVRPGGRNDPARLVPGDDAPVRLGAVPLVAGPVDGPQIAAAQARRFHLDQHLLARRDRNIGLAPRQSPVAGQHHAAHLAAGVGAAVNIASSGHRNSWSRWQIAGAGVGRGGRGTGLRSAYTPAPH